jgi:transposase
MESTTPKETNVTFVGLDIGSTRLDYSRTEQEEATFENNPNGRRQLIGRLKSLEHPRVICEASGGYEKALVAELLAEGIELCVVQPGRVRAFAYAEGLLAKTDRIDARLLRRFGEKVQPRLVKPVDPVVSALRELIEHRRQLTQQTVEVEGRMVLAGPTLRKLLQHERTFLRKQLQQVEKMIAQHIDQDPTLRHKAQRLQQLDGVGPVLAATLLAYVPELGQLEDAQLSALIGVAPHPKDSDHTRRPRHIRAGRAPVRHVLYMAAVAATRCNPVLAAFYQRLRAKGKPAKVGIIAVMRKMLCLLNRLIAEPDFVLAG